MATGQCDPNYVLAFQLKWFEFVFKFVQQNYFVELSLWAVFSSRGFRPCQSENSKCVFPNDRLTSNCRPYTLFCLFTSQYDKAQWITRLHIVLTFHISTLQSLDLMDNIVLIINTN